MRVDTNIIDMTEWGNPVYWCRIQYRGAFKQKSFPFSRYGDKEKALNAARRWRDQASRKLGSSPRQTGYVKHRRYQIRTDKRGKSLDLPVGVTRAYKPADHYADGIRRLYIAVNWRDHWDKDWPKREMVRQRLTSFFVGPVDATPPEVLREAIRCACEFRKAYETALKRGKIFDEHKTKLRLRRRLERTRRQCELK